MATEIVKVQVPVMTLGVTDPADAELALVYDQRRKHIKTMPIPAEVRRALDGDPKGYFRAMWSASANGWRINERVAEQHW